MLYVIAMFKAIAPQLASHFPILRLKVVTVLICLSVLILPQSISRADEVNPIGLIMNELDKSDKELVIKAIKEVPKHLLSKEDREIAEQAVRAGMNVHQILKDAQEGDISFLGRLTAQAAEDWWVDEVKQRYPEHTPVGKLLSSVENNHETYKALAKAALNADSHEAAKVLRGAVKNHAATKFNSLISEGEDFWKGLVRGVIPGADKLNSYGIDPIDIYLQGINNWADFVQKSGNRFHRAVLNCYHQNYTDKLASGVAPGDAKSDIATTQISDANCGGEVDNLLSAQGGTAWSLNRAGGASTLGKLGVNSFELADFVVTYENGRDKNKTANFANWMERRFNQTLKEHQKQLFEPILAQQSDYAGREFDRIIGSLDTLVSTLPQILIKGLGAERFKELGGDQILTELNLPEEDYLQEGEVDKFSPEIVEDEKKLQQKIEVAEAIDELECDPDYNNQRTNTNNGGLDLEFKPQGGVAGYGPEFVDKDGCRPYGPVTKKLEYIPPEEIVSLEPTKSADEPDPCATHVAALDRGKSLFALGDVEQAYDIFRSIVFSLNLMSNPNACLDARRRSIGNLEKVSNIVTLIGRVEEGLLNCDPDELKNHAEFLNDAYNKRLVDLRRQIDRARPIAASYINAKEAYWRGDVDHSKFLFEEALRKAKSTAGETCEDIDRRIENNLKRIETLQTFDNAAVQAIQSCDMILVSNLLESVRGNTNPFLSRAYDELANVPDNCRQKLGDESCQSDYGEQAIADLSNSSNDSYSCQCRSGYAWKPDAPKGNDQCITKRAADKISHNQNNSWCLGKYGGGYYAGRSDRNGNYFCLPTRKAANAWCRNNNAGSGLYAGAIKVDGSYNCYRRQITTAAKPIVRQLQPVQQYTQRRGVDPAAAAAVIGAIIQGVDAYQRSQGGGYIHGSGGGDCSVNPMAAGC